jgi:hypothetical protein
MLVKLSYYKKWLVYTFSAILVILVVFEFQERLIFNN